jgi:cysteine synthase
VYRQGPNENKVKLDRPGDQAKLHAPRTGQEIETPPTSESAANAKRAGEGNRTLVSSLGSWRSTIELHPHSNCPDSSTSGTEHNTTNPHNVLAHYRFTGPEILAQTRGDIDVLVAGMGTSGTQMGISQYLDEKLTSPTRRLSS